MKKILVLDDDVNLLYLIELILKDNNFVVKTTPYWPDVSKMIKTFVPDIILMDIDLNGADGGDLCKTLKQSAEIQKVPIVLCSAYSMTPEYVSESSAQGFLRKPFAAVELVNIVSNTLNASVTHPGFSPDDSFYDDFQMN